MANDNKSLSFVLVSLIANLIVICYHVEAGELPKIIQSEEKSYKKNVGEDVKLRCRATGAQDDTNNRTLFFWKNQFGLIRQDRTRWPRYEIRQNKFLRIRNIQPQDAGVYICTATNEYGYTDARRILKVYQNGKEVKPVKPDKKNRPVRKRPPPHAVKFMKGYQLAPKIVIEGKPKPFRTLLVGESTKLKCTVNAADPPPVIAWTKNGKSLQSSPRILHSPNHQIVHFKNLTTQDSGNYTCIVGNRFGIDNYTYVVVVKKQLKSQHPISVSFNNVVAVFGNNFTLNCATKTKRKRGMPRFRWIKYFPMSTKVATFKAPVQSIQLLNKKKRRKDNRIQWRFVYHKNGTIVASLTFLNVTKSDQGWYICRTGSSQSAKIINGISVAVVPKIDVDKSYKEKKQFSGKRKRQSIEKEEGIPLFLLITVPVVAGIICITVVLVCWRRHKKKENNAKRSRPDPVSKEQEHSLTNGHTSRCSQNGSVNSLRNGLHRAPNGAAITVVHHDPVTGTRLQYVSQSESINSGTMS